MPDSIKLVRVFIASPGGLADERQAAQRIVQDINRSHSEHWGCQIILVGWESTLPSYQRAQSLINQDLDRCDYFSGVVWNSWGSRPDALESRYASGFEEEFERARAHLEAGRMKDIALFFKAIPAPQIVDPGPSVARVIAFREECIREHKLLFKDFEGINEFERYFRETIERIGWQEAEITSRRSLVTPETAAENLQSAPTVPNAVTRLIPERALEFLREISDRPAEWDATTPYEVARFRLIATSIERSGNDKMHRGVHDSNLLFSQRSEISFTDEECNALVDGGVSGFRHQNVPLWYWIARKSNAYPGFRRVEWNAVLEGSPERENGIRILQACGLGVPTHTIPNREEILSSWFSDQQCRDVASDFLVTNGSDDDLNILRETLTSASQEWLTGITSAIVGILARRNKTEALEQLVDIDPSSINRRIPDMLFDNPEAFPTVGLQKCLTIRADSIRKLAVQTLNERLALSVVDAERLMADSDPDIRVAAVTALWRHGKAPDEKDIKASLFQPSRGLFAIPPSSSYSDTSYYDKFRREQLATMSFIELSQEASKSTIFDHVELGELYFRFTSKVFPEIERNLSDGVKQYFDYNIANISSSVRDRVLNLEDTFRKELTTRTLEALCSRATAHDLGIIRKTLDDHSVEFSEPVLRFLGQFGDWSDKDRILAFIGRYAGGSTLLSVMSTSQTHIVADALYRVGKKRLPDLFRLPLEPDVLRHVIEKLTHNEVRRLVATTLTAELSNDNQEVRKIVAIKCANALNQGQIRRLLDRYLIQPGTHYYNSVH